MEVDMTDGNDYSYFRQRAEQEREIAARCEDNAVALAHRRFADEYERRAVALRTAMPDRGSAIPVTS
jgi:hypothetical protein